MFVHESLHSYAELIVAFKIIIIILCDLRATHSAALTDYLSGK